MNALAKSTQTLRSVGDLLDAGLVGPEEAEALAAVAARYAVAITPAMATLVDAGDAADPIARQFVPDARELETTPDEIADPIGDSAHEPVKGIVHRYADRVLLKPLHVCAVYCRFCFRRETVGPGGDALDAEEFRAALAYIAGRTEIWEVILTGGDPFMLSPRRIAEIGAALRRIDHVRVVRWHTRVPVVDPARVSEALVSALKIPGKAVWVAIHANHPREFMPEAEAAIARLADAGIPLVSQSVLLRGVNDDALVLDALMRRFVQNRVKPYYLHHADLAPGTSHLRTTLAEGQALMRELRGTLSGLAQPTYVLDTPGGYGKVPAGPEWITETGEGEYVVTDPNGGRHLYPPLEGEGRAAEGGPGWGGAAGGDLSGGGDTPSRSSAEPSFDLPPQGEGK